MNSQIMKMVLSMVSSDKIADMLHGITQGLIEYKNMPIEPGETATRIVIFDDNGILYATITATNAEGNDVRQIETHELTELIQNLLKKASK